MGHALQKKVKQKKKKVPTHTCFLSHLNQWLIQCQDPHGLSLGLFYKPKGPLSLVKGLIISQSLLQRPTNKESEGKMKNADLLAV